ncbi:MAG: GLUG motif-containing protein, partial [Gallionella sp.]|nr:GLUG motif-containing protein [Gallionella sp.]
MNHTYRLVWSRISNSWIAVAENVKSQGKSSSGRKGCVVGAIAGSAFLVSAAMAAPVGGQISAGSGTITQSGLNTTINQASQNLAINWQSFGIAANEAVRFNQPGASSIALNRITGQDPSQILGSLSANGQVFILNPNGVLFGNGSQVNVGGLVASTLGLSDADFMAGKSSFSGNGGSVVNQGTLTAAQNGYIAMLAPEVRNEGVISATLGTALLAAGDKVTLNLNNGSLLSYSIDQGAINALADNKQLIQADGGQVFMSARAADVLSTAAVNNTGIVQARTIQNVGGVIKLMGDMQTGTVNVGGTLDASAPNGGNGGFIETSAAHVHVANDAKVTTLAANGLNGTWLIDPVNFTIAAAGGDMTGAAVTTALSTGNVFILSTTGGTGTEGDINVNDAVSWNANSLVLTAQNNININAVMTATGTAGLGLEFGQGAVAAGNTSKVITGINGKVNLPAGTTNFTTLQGSNGVLKNYTVITSLGAAGSANQADLQGMNGSTWLGTNYALGADINAAATSGWNMTNGLNPFAQGFTPIVGFLGTFDGLGHTITGLTINRQQSLLGLFGSATSTSIIRNVGLVGGSVDGRGSWTIGGLVGYGQGTISNSYNTGTVSSIGGGYIGGLVGNNSYGTINTSYTTGNVSGTNYVGGLVGNNSYGTINTSYTTGNVSGNQRIGGLVGYSYGTVNNSYHTTGSVTGASYVGGLVGSNYGTVTNSFYEVDTVAVNGANSPGAHGIYANQFGAWQAGGLVALNVANYFTNISGNNYSVGTVQNMQDLLAFNGNAALTFTLAGNIDLATAPAGFYLPTWAGTFDGANNTLSNFTLSNSNGNIGLFGKTEAGSHINNLGLLNVNVSGTTGNNVGGLVGHAYGTISNSYTTGSVSSTTGHYVGGLVGNQSYGSSVIASHSTATVSSTSGGRIGGLVGYSYGTISNSYASGNVSSTTGSRIGGLVGEARGTISNSYASGSVSGVSYVGGLVGQDGGTVSNSYRATGSVTGTGSNVGALVGGGYGSPTNSFYDMDVVSVNGATSFGANGLYTGQFSDWKNNSFALNPVTYFGAATAVNTYTVSGVQGLKDLLGFTSNAALTFNLAGNIDMAAAPVGFYLANWAGTFDGAGNTISNFTLNNPIDRIGFFGRTAAGSTVKNLGLLNVAVTGSNYVGGLVGLNYGTVSNSYTTGNVTGASNVGGLVGQNYGSGIINTSHSSATTSVTTNGVVGGLAGQNYGTIDTSYATGNVSSTTGDYVGGLVGYDDGTISNSYATGNVSSASGWRIGGLVGYGRWNNTIDNSYATGNVSTTGSYVGGLVGYGYGAVSNSYATGNVSGANNVGGLQGYGRNSATISNSYATGNVTGTSNVGGLVGYSYGAVSNSYATGLVTGTSNVGGLVGYGFYGTVNNSYATGLVTGTGNVGGLVGYSYGATLAANFWDVTTSGLADGLGIGSDYGTLGVAGTPQTGVSGLTTTQMHAQASFTPAGTAAGQWDFTPNTGTWVMFEGQSNPLLRALMTQLTVTANDASKTYDGLAYNGGAGVTYSVTPSMSLGTLSYTGASQGATNAGSYAITASGLTSNQSYLISFVDGTLTVSKANATVTANSGSGTYSGVAQSVNGFTASGLVNGETASVLAGVTATGATGTNAGSYTSTASGTDGNYNLTFANGTLTISKA